MGTFLGSRETRYIKRVDKKNRYKIMGRIHTFESWLDEASSGEIYRPSRGRPLIFDPRKHPELAGEFYDLISTAYAEVGGHAKISSPSDVFADPDWTFWEGIDIHGTPDFDVIMFGQKTRYGIKWSGVGHDGTSDAKRSYIESRGRDLHKLGYYVEVSGRIAEILIQRYNCPVVMARDVVERVLGRPVEWTGRNEDDPRMPGEGWYKRLIGGGLHSKTLLGRPRT
jgi:hypothetical protein